MIKKRKPRSDRNHIVYELKVARSTYIGVTRLKKSAEFSARRRFLKHVNRAMTEGLDWALCQAIRKHGPERFKVTVLAIVRGKAEAHSHERQLIRAKNPKLNSDKRGVNK
jgi:hypothetical protein